MDDRDEQQQLQRTINNNHEDLDRNLAALEAKAEDLVDWRKQFDRNPAVFLGLAAGGGLLAAALLGGSSRGKRRRGRTTAPAADNASFTEPARSGDSAWSGIREAAGVIATSLALEVLHEAVPGFKEKFDSIKAKVESSRHRTMSSS